MHNFRTTQVEVAPGVIDLGIGNPGFDLLPVDLVRKAAQHRLAQNDPTILNYGYEQGDGRFRLALERFLGERYGMPIEAEDLFVTTGISTALDLLCTLYTRPGDVIFVEEPTYFLALRIFADHGLKVVAIPTDQDGLVIEELEYTLANRAPVFLYTVPVFQNPSGVTLSEERRKRLVALSQEYDFMIIADEVYHMLDYAASPPPPMAAYIQSGQVFSLGSFSKILAPGLRLGWIQAEPERLHQLNRCGLLDSGGGLNPFTSSLVQVILEQGWQASHLDNLKAILGHRLAVLQAALDEYLGDFVKYSLPQGGYFFWLELPAGQDAADLLSSADRFDIKFQPGVRFSSQGGLRKYLRISFAFYGEQELSEGVRRLSRLLVDA